MTKFASLIQVAPWPKTPICQPIDPAPRPQDMLLKIASLALVSPQPIMIIVRAPTHYMTLYIMSSHYRPTLYPQAIITTGRATSSSARTISSTSTRPTSRRRGAWGDGRRALARAGVGWRARGRGRARRRERPVRRRSAGFSAHKTSPRAISLSIFNPTSSKITVRLYETVIRGLDLPK
jgi:hypothetical protein